MAKTGGVRVIIAGAGLEVAQCGLRPAGILRGGAFDPAEMAIYLAGPGHPDGCAAAGGNPSSELSGISVFVREDGAVFWANDSLSLWRVLSDDEILLVQVGLQAAFAPHPVRRLDRISDVRLS